jgi:YidC/Oxa1 family membrane protein insertase
VINQSVDLRGAHFLWIKDLSQPDRLFHLPFMIPILGADFNLLPLIMAATQILTSKLTTTQAATADPQQAEMQKMMTWFMPVFMLFIFYGMPSGLVLYWTVSNIWQVLQQLWVNKHMPMAKAPVAPARPAPRKA